MKDLDFDELDRAVSSLMSGVPKSNVPRSTDNEKTITIPTTLPDDGKIMPGVKPVDDTLAPTEVKTDTSSNDVAARPARPLAARRPGRFMDVVHPSSAMKKSTSPALSVSRQAPTLEPVTPVRNDTPADDLNRIEPVLSSVDEPIKHTAPVENEWPDPLDLADFKHISKADDHSEPVKSSTQATLKSSAESEDDQVSERDSKSTLQAPHTTSDATSVQAASSSPFLADAKVEKRPLGKAEPSLQDNDTSPEPPAHPPVSLWQANDTPQTKDDPNDQLPARAQPASTQLPEELQSDLMAIEADTTHDDIAHSPKQNEAPEPITEPSSQSFAKPMSKQQVRPAVPQTSSDDSTSPWKKPVALIAAHEPEIPSTPEVTGATSISQQYRETPTTGDQSSGAIYDTDTYHQPLAHPAKKKSGWLWIVWIVLVLVIGAGCGALLYFLGVV